MARAAGALDIGNKSLVLFNVGPGAFNVKTLLEGSGSRIIRLKTVPLLGHFQLGKTSSKTCSVLCCPDANVSLKNVVSICSVCASRL